MPRKYLLHKTSHRVVPENPELLALAAKPDSEWVVIEEADALAILRDRTGAAAAETPDADAVAPERTPEKAPVPAELFAATENVALLPVLRPFSTTKSPQFLGTTPAGSLRRLVAAPDLSSESLK